VGCGVPEASALNFEQRCSMLKPKGAAFPGRAKAAIPQLHLAYQWVLERGMGSHGHHCFGGYRTGSHYRDSGERIMNQVAELIRFVRIFN
jgi:hypothetical protein